MKKWMFLKHTSINTMNSLCCATLKRSRCYFFLKRASQNCIQSGANRFCLRISKKKDPSCSADVSTRYLIRKKKILNLKSRSKMLVLECGIFSSMKIQKTARSHLRTNSWSHRYEPRVSYYVISLIQHTTSAWKFLLIFWLALSATNLKITKHHHALSLRIIKYAHYVPLRNIHTVNAFPTFGSVSTVKKMETDIAPLLWAADKKKKKRQETMLNTNNRHLNNSHQSIQSYPANSYSHVLAISNSPGHSTSITSVNSPQVTLILYKTVSLSQFTLFQHSKKAAFQMQLSAYLLPQ